ncbi:uncharacterized protein N7515_006451 [Penicillium bovifimosum]|uniref:F-box domain-containing protein n=1 Tax=Penicillium bovifimosum TaxID=126998 RepID=A0A9W9L183_9EURO|nr:uncharacterized protein N7515_006451 [Penicillium bovifimosum]KAJ5130412.1 hypothetical protein N7515_006451 [Penicillium bovifimosum]
MDTPTNEMSIGSDKSSFLHFPLEIWDMIIEQLKHEESPQHLSRLAQTCQMLYQRTLPLLYSPVCLANSESGARLAVAIEQRPELAELIREIRHKEDSGSELSSGRHLKFYKMAAGLPNLETLSLRRNPRPHKFDKWTVHNIQTVEAREAAREAQTVGEYRDMGFGPLGQSQFSPPDIRTIPFDYDRGDETLFWHALLQHPPGLPALRVCHIGSDFNHDKHNLNMDCANLPQFNEAIFRHPGLRVLCITGATFQLVLDPSHLLRHTNTQLEDLTLLNCVIEDRDLMYLLECPRALKRFTFRATRIPDSDGYQPENDYTQALLKHQDSLEYIDYDLYWGSDDLTYFSIFTKLKHLTVTLSSLAGVNCLQLTPEDELLPPSLESLTIRYDEVKSWVPSYVHECVQGGWLPNLRLLTCEVANIIEHLPSANIDKFNLPATEICQVINTWQSQFEEFNVELRAEIVPYPLDVPKYEVCVCECLPFFHRMFFHPRVELPVPWEGNEQEDVFYDDWADIDDEHDLDDEIEDLVSEGFGSDISG